MNRSLGCLSAYGLIASLLAWAAVCVWAVLKGSALFSPGPLTAAGPGVGLLLGYANHAEMERQCTFCHQPWRGVQPRFCLTCHTTVDQQIAAASGLHGRIQDAAECTLCHTEHLGREARITLVSSAGFPHEQTAFSLARHQNLDNGSAVGCSDCHAGPDYSVDGATCTACHTRLDAGRMEQHVDLYGSRCLNCHDGSGYLSNLNHDATFPLQGKHAALLCDACHGANTLQGLSSECAACHQEPDFHLGQFGARCVYCHTAEGWSPARLQYHTFELDHGSETELACEVCHSGSYATYTCETCHDTDQVTRVHQSEGIHDTQDCISCHATGREKGD